MGLSTAELAQIRADIGLLFPDTCDILSNAGTIDAEGGYNDVWGTATASVSCRVDYMTGKEAMTGGAVVPYQKAVVSMAHDETVTTDNRLYINGETFSIQAVNVEQSWIGVKRIIAELVP